MANQRVVDSDVKRIFPECTIDTQPFIETANLIVTERLTSAGYSEARLQQLELYISADLADSAQHRVVELDADGASVKYEAGKLGFGRFLAHIQRLDYLGVLESDVSTSGPAWIKVY